ncbi:hypothetical protein RJ639_020820 [Escallonia herrerae]|uniref:Uncharacterized protein n=1 Tax=Escallonia herrerae TaxID=1293975 RepID=A0AA88V689_9ASTE|nr:hypothetical protein RJ639_020820 [Escallonia herrerae]
MSSTPALLLVGVENQLSKLRNLEVLDLRINNLDSRILSSINGLASLRSLYLSDNYLNSSIHLKDFIGGFANLPLNLTNLEVLDLTFTQLDNSILSSLHGLSSLRSLNLSANNLGGSSHMRVSRRSELWHDDLNLMIPPY